MMCVIDDASIWIEQRNDEYNSHYYDTEFPGLKLWQLEFALHFVMGGMPLAQRIRTPNGPYHDCLSKHNNSSEVGTLPVLAPDGISASAVCTICPRPCRVAVDLFSVVYATGLLCN